MQGDVPQALMNRKVCAISKCLSQCLGVSAHSLLPFFFLFIYFFGGGGGGVVVSAQGAY